MGVRKLVLLVKNKEQCSVLIPGREGLAKQAADAGKTAEAVLQDKITSAIQKHVDSVLEPGATWLLMSETGAQTDVSDLATDLVLHQATGSTDDLAIYGSIKTEGSITSLSMALSLPGVATGIKAQQTQWAEAATA